MFWIVKDIYSLKREIIRELTMLVLHDLIFPFTKRELDKISHSGIYKILNDFKISEKLRIILKSYTLKKLWKLYIGTST